MYIVVTDVLDGEGINSADMSSAMHNAKRNIRSRLKSESYMAQKMYRKSYQITPAEESAQEPHLWAHLLLKLNMDYIFFLNSSCNKYIRIDNGECIYCSQL